MLSIVEYRGSDALARVNLFSPHVGFKGELFNGDRVFFSIENGIWVSGIMVRREAETVFQYGDSGAICQYLAKR